MPDSQRLTDPSDLRKYRHELPNLIDDLGLSPFAYRLYGHIKRRCGASADGQCYEATRKIAEHCKMSAGMVFKAKRELEEAGLIKITFGSAKTNTADTITVVDVWQENFSRYQTCSSGEQVAVHGVNRPVHGSPQTCSPDEPKKEPVEEIEVGEEPRASDPRGFPFDHPAVEMFVAEMEPDPGLPIKLAEKIAAEVTDLATWREVLVVFSGNGYRGRDGTGRNVGNTIHRYWTECKRKADGNGKPDARAEKGAAGNHAEARSGGTRRDANLAAIREQAERVSFVGRDSAVDAPAGRTARSR